MVVPSRKIGTVVVAFLVALAIAQFTFLSPSGAQPDAVIRPQPSPVATFPAESTRALLMPEADSASGLPIPEADTGLGLPMPEFIAQGPWREGLVPSAEPRTTSPGVGGQFTSNCTACAPRQF